MMTQEEKARAYDEMVQRVKELHETGNFLTKKQMEIICPELADSEDEKIRKWIIDELKDSLHEIEIMYSRDYDNRDEQDKERQAYLNKALAYLEKQKIFSENGEGVYAYKDGKIYFWQWLDNSMYMNSSPVGCDNNGHLVYMEDLEDEKQKENPKSADSIPPDCTSDVRCEDRWHKATDSLPDNGREVLAKDKLGNTLLARYDGEGWDVSVYDDEDYRCHNGISKWCEIPSEKQKEPHYTKRNALFDKCVENCDPEVMKRVSDEIDEMLEKEQKPDEIDGKALLHVSNKSYDIGFRDGVASVKPAEWSEEDKEMVRVISNRIEKFDEWATEKGYPIDDPTMKQSPIAWLKSFLPQPQQNMSIGFMLYLDEHRPDGKMCLSNAECNEIEAAFKNQSWDTILKYVEKYQPHWKPSEEQMVMLRAVINDPNNAGAESCQLALKSIYEQLHKLI